MSLIPKMLRFLLIAGTISVVLGGLCGAIILMVVVPGLPAVDSLRDVRLQVPLRVYSNDGGLIAEFGEKRRLPVTRAEVPERLIQAFLAAEDDRFYTHPGVDWQGIVRAVVRLIQTGDKAQGGSTITMQVARNFFLSREKTYLRKFNEILLAFKIENELSKDEILELYLNKIYLGQRAYGIGSAAHVYYGKTLAQLDLAQMATIAGLPKAPSADNPVTNPERSVARRAYVLRRMVELGRITQDEYALAKAAPVSAYLHGQAIELRAPYIAEMVRAEMVERFGEKTYTEGYVVTTTIDCRLQRVADRALRESLYEYEERHGFRGPLLQTETDDAGEVLEQSLVAVFETFAVIADLHPAVVLEVGEREVLLETEHVGLVSIEWAGLKWAREYIDVNQRGPVLDVVADALSTGDVVYVRLDEDNEWRLAQKPGLQGALISLSPTDGAITALSGGFQYFASKYNRATQARRQPGSSFKPFIYSAALDQGYTAASLINDAPVVFDDPGLETVWRPENYSGKFFGPTRLREALTHSRNLVSIRLLRAIGVRQAVRYISRFGFDAKRLPANLSLALGSGTVTPLELARGYAVIANRGYQIDPYLIQRVSYADGTEVMRATPATVCRACEDYFVSLPDAGSDPVGPPPMPVPEKLAERVVDERNAWLMTSLMRNVIKNGTGRRARVLGRNDLSGKTGTTNDQRDAWFSGFNDVIVTTVWVGFDAVKTLGRRETGARAALPVWIRYMRQALKGMPEIPFEQPEGLVTVRIDPVTGLLTGAENPAGIFETFRAEFVPERVPETTVTERVREAPGSEQLF